MNNLQEKLDFLLDKYDVSATAELIDALNVKINGEKVPLLPWRQERRFIELKNLIDNKTVYGISVMRSCRIVKKGEDIKHLIYRELDLCQWLLSSEIENIKYFAGSGVVNMVARMKSGVVCTIEIATTLSNNAPVIDKHEIITQRGIACDRVVDTQIPQYSVYVFADENESAYLDVDFELFGLDIEEISLVRQAFTAAKDTELVGKLKYAAKQLESAMKEIQL